MILTLPVLFLLLKLPMAWGELSKEEYSVYAVLLKTWASRNYVVQAETRDAVLTRDFHGAIQFLRRELQKQKPLVTLPDDLAVSYKQVYGQSVPLEPSRLGVPAARMVSRADVEHFMQTWDDFEKGYPGATTIITMSRVGFNKDETKALVSMSQYCGGLCGEAAYVILEKVGRKWVARARVIALYW